MEIESGVGALCYVQYIVLAAATPQITKRERNAERILADFL